MQTRNRIIAACASALLLGATFAPAAAVTLNLNNGVHLNGAPTNSGVNVNTGSGKTIGSVGGHAKGSTGGAVAITNANKDLLKLGSKGNRTNGTLNLGGVDLSGLGLEAVDIADLGNLLGGAIPPVVIPPVVIPPPVIPPPDITPPEVSGGFADLSSGDQALLKIKCRSVLVNPAGFDANVVRLCRLIAQISG